MIHYTKFFFHGPDLVGKRNKIDNTIYTFDIETTSFIELYGEIYSAEKYEDFSEKEKEDCVFYSNMYIWMFSINEIVYYGRTWDELKIFLNKLELFVPSKKILFIHNLSFEFQYLKSEFNFENVLARKSHKTMRCNFEDYNFECRCTYFMTNAKLENLPKIYQLDVEKQVGKLDYKKIRHNKTPLNEDELLYCKYDCLVLYKYIQKELLTYERVDKIPLTSTGKVRKELKDEIKNDFKYKREVKNSININPHIYNLLLECFMGGYTHANWIYTDSIIKNVDSWDFTSSYPFVMVSEKYPATEFKKCNIKNVSEMSKRFAYIIKVKFKKIKSKYYNNFISQSKCRNIRGARYDNGRIMFADELEITLTDIDFYFILKTHKFESYEIIESYFSLYKYLPIKFINFILKKYINKTKYKNVAGMELEYNLEKGKFNALYGMSVTNNIRDEVVYDNEKGWSERKLENDEIEESLYNEKEKGFLSFSYGVWITAYARKNLLENVVKLDDYVIYCDTDSIKLKNGYNKKIIEEYNISVLEKLEKVSNILEINIEDFMPKDNDGIKRIIGLFDFDGHYEEFITQGAKKYAVVKKIKNSKLKKDMNVIKQDEEYSDVIEITVAGVPKKRFKGFKNIRRF